MLPFVFIFPLSLLFHRIAIPWLQAEIDNWVKHKNTTAAHAMKHKILLHGVPTLIHSHPSHFNTFDFKIFSALF
jgi:hypothetical protein